MATQGNTSEPTSGQEWSGSSTNNQVAHAVTMPGGGPWEIYKVGLWLAGKDGAATMRAVVWNESRNSILAQSSTFSAASRSFGVGQNDNYEIDVPNFEVSGGEKIYVGFHRSDADNSQWGVRGSGTHYDDSGATSGPEPMAGESSHANDIGAYVFYRAADDPPDAPSNVKLENSSSGSVLVGSDNLYLLTFSSNESIDEYDYQIDTTTGNGVAPDWASLTADVAGETNGISGSSVSSTRTHALSRGQWYAMRVRTMNDGLTGAWSSVYYFKINSLPTVTSRVPAASAFAYIHNLLTDLTTWTSGGSHAKPRFTFVYNDADGQQSAAYRVRIYNAASGTEGDASQVHDSGEVAKVVSSGATITHDATFAIVAGTERWWTVKVKDSLGEWSAESSRTAFKMRFAQGIYEFNAGAGSSGWSWANGQITNGYGAILFRTATGAAGAGAGSWVTSIGALTPAAYVNVLVRLAPNAAGTNVTLPDMTFSYIGGATTPDRWNVDGSGASIVLDLSTRRFGARSLKVTTGAATCRVYPYTFPAGSQADIPVVGGVTYTWSAYVKTNGVLSTGIRAAVFGAGTFTELVDPDSGLTVVSETITDSSSAEDGWHRLSVTFRVPAGVSFVRPGISYLGTTAGQVFWVDAVQLEEGTVTSHWRPGLVGNAMTLDLNGIMVDGFAGGIVRMRGTAGGARDIIELGANGLLFGGDTPISSPATGNMRITDTNAALQLSTDARMRRNGTKIIEFDDAAGGALSAVRIVGAAPLSLSTDVRLFRSGTKELSIDDGTTVRAKIDTNTGQFTEYGDNVFSTYVPTLGNAGSAGHSTITGYYMKVGKMVFVVIYLVCNANGTGTGVLNLTTPSEPDRSSRQFLPGHAEGHGSPFLSTVTLVALVSGSGAVWDRIRPYSGSGGMIGTDYDSGGILSFAGWYREV